MAVLILYNLAVLIRLYRRRVPGARLTLRLAGVFAVLAITPVALVYGFSLHFCSAESIAGSTFRWIAVLATHWN